MNGRNHQEHWRAVVSANGEIPSTDSRTQWQAVTDNAIPVEPNWPEEYVLSARVDLRSCSAMPVQHLVSLGQERHTWADLPHIEVVNMPDRSFSAGDVLVVRGFAILYDDYGYTPLDLST